MDVRSRLREEFALAEADVERLQTYVRLVRTAQLNLTAWSEEELWERGVFESLRLRPWLMGQGSGRALDIGSGGGIPGLVLAVTCREWIWTLMEARERRGQFLRETVATLGLVNVSVVIARAEEWIYSVPEARAGFLAVTMRAVARAPVSVELGLPYAAKGGLLFLVQSQAGYAELVDRGALLKTLGGQVERRDKDLTIVAKVGETPRHYPRVARRLGS